MNYLSDYIADLDSLIMHYSLKLDNPKLTHTSRNIAERTLSFLQNKRTCLEGIKDPEEFALKVCWRFCTQVPVTCDRCDHCLQPEDLAWNESEDDIS